MNKQRHIIKTQVLELQFNSMQGAWELQNEISKIYYNKITPLLEVFFNECCDAKTIVRIDTLEIDLGNIDLQNLEQEILEQLKKQIPQQLREKISSLNSLTVVKSPSQQQDVSLSHFSQNVNPAPSELSMQQATNTTLLPTSHPPNQRDLDLELFSYFIQTGMLPWWANTFSKQELEESCDRLITTSLNQIQPVFLQSFEEQRQLQRLIYQFSDILLLKIINLFVSHLSQFITNFNNTIKEICKQTHLLQAIPQQQLRLERWRGIFFSLSLSKNIKPQKSQIVRETLLHIATSFHISYHALINQIVKTLESPSQASGSFSGELTKIIVSLHAETVVNVEQLDISPDTVNNLHDFHEIDNYKSENLDNFQDAISEFSYSNEIYIYNAGLVLLWPFLNRFFEQIELVQKHCFINSNAAERAVLLLQYIVDSSTEPSEAALPLNKFLCGIEFLQPVAAHLEITEQEQLECENLLLAVLQNWPLLKNTSIEGLQNAFLQRKGILRIRDGSWLLQVEKATYDILLDRLPWSISVIKLPWMDEVLYVEWP